MVETINIELLDKSDFIKYVDTIIPVNDTKTKYQAIAYTSNHKYVVTNISRYKDGTIKISGSYTFTESISKIGLLKTISRE